MSSNAEEILGFFQKVAGERARRRSVAGLASKVNAVKEYQQRRFTKSYADLLESHRYAPAALFFLDELYGPQDFTRRDAQFARVVPALVKLFPQEVVEAVRTLAQLHALSESLDSSMAEHLEPTVAPDTSRSVTEAEYSRAWQQCSRADRPRQLALTLELGATLDRLARKPMLRQSLRLMRGPARAAGLAELQTLLERGFEAFRAMQGSAEFLALVRDREQAFASAMDGMQSP